MMILDRDFRIFPVKVLVQLFQFVQGELKEMHFELLQDELVVNLKQMKKCTDLSV